MQVSYTHREGEGREAVRLHDEGTPRGSTWRSRMLAADDAGHFRYALPKEFGGKEGAIKAYAPVLERAESAGLNIDFAAIERTPNTLDAHRLLHWAEVEHCQDAMAMALFRAYFEEGRDIGDHEVLADIADGLSLDAALIRRLLASEADRAEITERDTRFRKMGITGVPTFIVNGQHALPGCQPAETWLRIIDEIAAFQDAAG